MTNIKAEIQKLVSREGVERLWIDDRDNGDGYVVHETRPDHVQGRLIEVIEYAALEAERERSKKLVAALDLLLKDVQDYETWARPCYAVDVAREALKSYKEGAE